MFGIGAVLGCFAHVSTDGAFGFSRAAAEAIAELMVELLCHLGAPRARALQRAHVVGDKGDRAMGPRVQRRRLHCP